MTVDLFGFLVGAGTRRGGVVAAVGPSDGLDALALLWGSAPGIEVLDVRRLSDVDVVAALRGGIPAGLDVSLVLAVGRRGSTLAERISGPVEIGEVAGLVVRVDARGRGVEVLKDRAGPAPAREPSAAEKIAALPAEQRASLERYADEALAALPASRFAPVSAAEAADGAPVAAAVAQALAVRTLLAERDEARRERDAARRDATGAASERDQVTGHARRAWQTLSAALGSAGPRPLEALAELAASELRRLSGVAVERDGAVRDWLAERNGLRAEVERLRPLAVYAGAEEAFRGIVEPGNPERPRFVAVRARRGRLQTPAEVRAVDWLEFTGTPPRDLEPDDEVVLLVLRRARGPVSEER